MIQKRFPKVIYQEGLGMEKELPEGSRKGGGASSLLLALAKSESVVRVLSLLFATVELDCVIFYLLAELL